MGANNIDCNLHIFDNFFQMLIFRVEQKISFMTDNTFSKSHPINLGYCPALCPFVPINCSGVGPRSC